MKLFRSLGMSTRLSFEELVTNLGLDYEKWCWPTLHKLVGSYILSFDELEVGRNQLA